MLLTQSNYHSLEANREYFSNSQIKSFRKCEAMAMAEINGEYTKEITTSLLVGAYVDAYFSGTLDEFKASNPEIFIKSGDLKSDYRKANDMIERLQQDEIMLKYLNGEKQRIMTGKIGGEKFKIKIDSYHADKAIVDLKTVASFDKVWVKNYNLNWIEAWDYPTQGAIYQQVEGNNLPFILAAITKEKVSDLGLFKISQQRLDLAYSGLIDCLRRYSAIKRGEVHPERCGICDYCKKTKKISGVITYSEDNDI